MNAMRLGDGKRRKSVGMCVLLHAPYSCSDEPADPKGEPGEGESDPRQIKIITRSSMQGDDIFPRKPLKKKA